MSSYKNRIITLLITEYSDDGHGLGYWSDDSHKNIKVEAPFTLPGDRVAAKLTRRRGGVWHSLLEEVMNPSIDRIAARCPHFGECGGCRRQYLPYEQQVKEKESFVRGCLASFLRPEVEIYSILPCDPPWNYRNKMELSFSTSRAGERFLGLMTYGGRGKAFNMQECHLCPSWMVEARHAVKKWWEATDLEAYYPPRNSGSLRTLILRGSERTGDRLAMLTVSGNPDYALQKKHLESLKVSLLPLLTSSQGKSSLFLRIQHIAKGKPTQFYEMLLYGTDVIQEQLYLQENDREKAIPLKFNISPIAFFQPNTLQAEKLYSRALQMAKIPPQSTVYDLYCGTGTIGVCAARHAKQVIGIELSPEAVLDAKSNCVENNLNNVKIFQGDVGKVLEQLQQSHDFVQPEVVFVDPPRAGLDLKAIGCLSAINASRIVYISCNPVSQAANIQQLLAHGYHLTAVQPVDQFPHTLHVENIVVLEKK